MNMKRPIDNLEMRMKTNPTYKVLEQLVMNYIVFQEDIHKAIEFSEKYYYLVDTLELMYVVTYNAIIWHINSEIWLDRLDKTFTKNTKYDRAVMYYLKALYYMHNQNDKALSLYYLKCSVDCSSGYNFVNNRLDIASLLKGRESRYYYREALNNVSSVFDSDEAINTSEDYYININNWIDEYILGIIMYRGTYELLRNKTK